MSSEGVAHREQPRVGYGDEPPAVEDRPLEEHGGGRLSWLIALAIVVPVIVLYAALGYAVYVIGRIL